MEKAILEKRRKGEASKHALVVKIIAIILISPLILNYPILETIG